MKTKTKDDQNQPALIAHEEAIGELETLKLADLPMRLVGEEPDAAFVESVCRQQIHPIVCRRPDPANPNGRMELIAGRRRVMGRRLGGMETIQATVFPHDANIHPAQISIAENARRSENPLLDLMVIERLHKDFDLDERQVCREVGLTTQAYRKRIQLRALIAELFKALTEKRLTITAAEVAARMTKEQQERLLPVLEKAGRVTMEDIQEARRAIRKEAAAALPASLFSDEGEADTPTPDVRGAASNETWDARVMRTIGELLASMPAAFASTDVWGALLAVRSTLASYGDTATAPDFEDRALPEGDDFAPDMEPDADLDPFGEETEG